MRFNYDLLPGEQLTFEEISQRYGQKYPTEKALTFRGLLSPSTSPRQLVIRAVFAHQAENSPLEDLLFVSDDNDRKNYLRRFEHYMHQGQSFLYLRRNDAAGTLWKVMGESRVYAMLDPNGATAQNLLASRGYRLTLMRQQGDDDYWQLYDPKAQPCFNEARTLQFIVVLETPMLPAPAAVIAGQQVGRRVRVKVLQRASQAEFSAAVSARYGGCVITGTTLSERASAAWVEACYIDASENSEGLLADSSVDNGLFLRSDLRRLFISGRLFIDGEQGTVHIRPALQSEDNLHDIYHDIDGKVCALWQCVPPATRERLKKTVRLF
ncbi:HNH endonuclease [Pantoea alhagi]|uniref:HNH endonuclease signature motif containing protein n=1 Tax=Pantoea alhagi TaxID=1891675 RepID=UPI00202B3E73|nr:HNH endonuclease signature motif containing protein [Pantoea alhagi]URQ59474.1 HNH endonuclease [Pantoea alhagi]